MSDDAKQIALIRQLHVEQDNGCELDGFVWPCSTARVLESLAASEARVSALTAALERGAEERARYREALANLVTAADRVLDTESNSDLRLNVVTKLDLAVIEARNVLAAADRQPDGEGQ